MLLIQRAVRPGDPGSGHVAFPGGRVEPADADLRATALRELEEEVGLTREDLEGPPRFLGIFAARAFALEVAIFAALLRPGAPGSRSLDPHEVESIFWLPLDAVRRPEPVVRRTPFGDRPVPAVRSGEHVLWGFTLRALGELLARLEGRPPPPELSGPPVASDEADPKVYKPSLNTPPGEPNAEDPDRERGRVDLAR